MKKSLVRFLAIVVLVAASAGAWAAKKAPEHPININNASAEELMTLPGIGKAKADAIIAYRQAHPFKDVAELTEVKGIGAKMLEKLQPSVTIDGSVHNTAAKPAVSAAGPTR